MDRHENCRCQPQPRVDLDRVLGQPPLQPDPDLIVFHDDQPSALVMLAVAGGLVVLGIALAFIGTIGELLGWVR